MSFIDDPANDNYNFGKDFNYAVWAAGTRLSLVNVSWTNDFKDVVRFANRQTLNAYIDNLESSGLVMEDMSYLKPNEPIRIKVPLNVASKYNYIRARNPKMPINSDAQKDYYYFIINARMIAPETTELTLQLDVFQTYIFDVTMGNCFVERGHIGIANANGFNDHGREHLTVPEGMDIGSDYQTIATAKNQIMTRSYDPANPTLRPGYNILVLSTIDIVSNPGTITNPQINSSYSRTINGIPSGIGAYLFENAFAWTEFVRARQTTPWVLQGVISITLLPDVRRYSPEVTFPENMPITTSVIYNAAERGREFTLYEDWRDSTEVVNNIPSEYRKLKKLWTFPYMMVELTTFNGTPIIIKPEAWDDDDMSIVERYNFNPPDQKVMFIPYRYNAGKNTPAERDAFGILKDDRGEWFDNATIVSQFPTLAFNNNQAAIVMANSARSIAYGYQSADWSQQRALASNQNQYSQASSAMRMVDDITANNINRGRAETALGNQLAADTFNAGAISNMVGGSVSGGIAGGVAGPAGAAIGGATAFAGGAVQAVAGAVTTNMQIAANSQRQGIAESNALANLRAQQGNAGFIRDSTKALADWAAQGDYANAIAGMNAKVQDIQMTPPAMVGQMGGSKFNLVHDNMILSARIKMIDLAAIRRVGDFWLRFGYSIRRFMKMPNDLMVMTNFTYWKVTELYIGSAPIPEGFKQAIRGIFEKGVTVWSDPDKIGMISLYENEIKEGITY